VTFSVLSGSTVLPLLSDFNRATSYITRPSKDGNLTTTPVLDSTISAKEKAMTPIPVFLWPNVNYSTFDDRVKRGYDTWCYEYKHFTLEGVERSPYLKRVYDDWYQHESLIWMVDLFQGRRPSRWCPALTKAIVAAQNKKPPPHHRWSLYMMDWNDDPNFHWQFHHCKGVYRLLGKDNIRYFKRSMVTGRDWNETTNSIDPGIIDPAFANNYSDWSSVPIQHLSYGVRSDILETMFRIVQKAYAEVLGNNSTIMIEDIDLASVLPRPLDVAHFWPVPERQKNKLEVNRADNDSQLRDNVSRAILAWNETHPNATGFAGLMGTPQETGRLAAQESYAEALLSYKIVVVAQKDHWEGHYRLMEALCSGALVLSDRELLIPEGLEDGKSIVVYDNVTDMIQKVEYYLWTASQEERWSIAREGRRVALTLHRSWHIMERVVFGKVMSNATS
jgi:hypothetical protein